MKARDILEDAVRTLKTSPAIDHWQKDREEIETEDMLGFLMGGEEPDPDDEVPASIRRRFARMVERRYAGEPVQFIKGFADFRGLELISKPGVFVPRDSTEFLAEQAIRRLRGRRRPIAVDLATGGGTVALALANEVRGTRVFGTDISREAIRVARRNADRLRLRAAFSTGDLFGALPREIRGKVDVITLHPPYVAKDEIHDLPEEIRRFEPLHTLTDHSPNGLGLVERTVAESGDWLRPGGWLLVEVSPDRARAVLALMRSDGFRDARSSMDKKFKLTRVLAGRW